MQIEGFRRLWVVGSAILAIATVIFGFNNISRKDDAREYYDQLMVSYQAKIKDLQHPNKDAVPGILYSARTNHLRTVDEVKSAIHHAEDEYIEELSNLPWKQTKQALALFGAWLACCVGVYGVGLTLLWIYRGFRPKVV